jgi:hypothetical protein
MHNKWLDSTTLTQMNTIITGHGTISGTSHNEGNGGSVPFVGPSMSILMSPRKVNSMAFSCLESLKRSQRNSIKNFFIKLVSRVQKI